MLNVAKTAKASNETLYRWYGDKLGLFTSMVHSNAANSKQLLENALATGDDPQESLERLAPVLLTMLLGDRAILLNRAAAADPSNELGGAIAAGGRNEIAPLVGQTIKRYCEFTDVSGRSPLDASGLYFSLLIGDLQIRRVIGILPVLSDQEIDQRCALALTSFFTLLQST